MGRRRDMYRGELRRHAWLLLLSGVLGAWAPDAIAAGDGDTLPPVAAAGPSLERDWLEAVRLEYAGNYRDAGSVYESILTQRPERADAAWRAARSFWRLGEEARLNAALEGEGWFERADGLAAKGLVANPHCGECALWKYAAMGRLVAHRGTLWAARHASDLRDLLELGIAARPAHRDPNGNSALANLYYSSAIFHRIVPEWFWLPIVIGVKGDTKRALVDIERALAISGDRIDYQIEHGAVLLCRAHRKRDKAAAREGVRVLERALELPPAEHSDEIDQHYARLLIEDPSQSCGFTRDGFLDVEAMGRDVGLRR